MKYKWKKIIGVILIAAQLMISSVVTVKSAHLPPSLGLIETVNKDGYFFIPHFGQSISESAGSNSDDPEILEDEKYNAKEALIFCNFKRNRPDQKGEKIKDGAAALYTGFAVRDGFVKIESRSLSPFGIALKKDKGQAGNGSKLDIDKMNQQTQPYSTE